MSIASLLGLGIYGIVVLACLRAATFAYQSPGKLGDAIHWAALSFVFVGLAALRLANGEDRLREFARGSIKAAGSYSERSDLQMPLAIAALMAFFVVCWIFARKWRSLPSGSRARLVLAARLGMFGIIALYALRLISLHSTDQLLYSGPIRLNWLLEFAFCLIVGISAALYGWGKQVPINRFSRPRDTR